MKQWAGYKRCPFYVPVCEHSEPKPQQDLLGLCKYYYFETGACSNADRCDGYGWVALSFDNLKSTIAMMQGDVVTRKPGSERAK